jgi:hypothetical protein
MQRLVRGLLQDSVAGARVGAGAKNGRLRCRLCDLGKCQKLNAATGMSENSTRSSIKTIIHPSTICS